jgi:membrane protease YdiL (CAAX protease family)
MCVIALSVLGYYELYDTSKAFAGVFNIVSYMLSAFVPFFIAYGVMTPTEKERAMRFNAPASKAMIPVTIVIGLAACTVGNFATGYLRSFVEAAGYEIIAGELPASSSVYGLLIDIVYVAALPALVEEFALRGVIMQPLRRYGDVFAIFMSSLVFALMHGNLLQIPFAFIVGIVIGYLVITTGSIWTGVLIHFFNNLYSVLITYLLEVRPTRAQDIYSVYNVSVFILGICGIAVFSVFGKRYSLRRGSSIMQGTNKFLSYVFSVPMLIAIFILGAETAYFIRYTG